MKKSKKIAIVTLALLCMCGCGKKEQLNNTNNPEGNKENQQIESKVALNDFQIELLSSNIENGTSEFTFEITNTSQETKYVSELEAIAKDSEGNDVITLFGVIEKEILSGEKEMVICSYGGDLSNIATFTYELK
ncbi:MAG: hypothetical protein K2M17_04105 [Bacilli bacterium]|nr:hypothetical protein [Bacilli bacterium]